MARCDVCGNEYEDTFTITYKGQTRTFDSFECAIHDCAPSCQHCGCKIIGHGVQQGKALFCCAHCARHADEHAPAYAKDHAAAHKQGSKSARAAPQRA